MREKIVPIEVTPEMMKMLEICKKNKSINPELYAQYAFEYLKTHF